MMQDDETIQTNVKCNYQNITDIHINLYFPSLLPGIS